MKKTLFFLTLIFFITTNVIAQAPANDACAGAQTVTPNGACTPGTTIGAGDNWLGSVGCAGNNPEVWYTFTATGSQLTVTVTAGTMGGNAEFVLAEATGPCAGLSIAGSLCGASVLTGTINGLQIGSLYYYTISSTGSTGTFTSCVNNVSPPPVSGQDCASAAILCSASSFTQSSSSAGFGTQEVNPTNSCWGVGGERQSKWFKFTVGCSGTLEFNINPVVSGDDYDWALWNVTTLGCPSTTNLTQTELACNWSGCKGSTGITTCANAVGEPGRVTSGSGCGGGPAAWNIQTINVTAGNTYALLVDNFSSTNNGFSLTFGGACGGGTAVLGPDAAFTFTSPSCGAFNFTKTCQTTNSTFLWTFGDGSTSTLQNPSHTYTVSGSFIVSLSVTDALGCLITTSQTIFVGIPTSNAGPDLALCSVATGTIGTATTAGYSYSWTPSTGLSSTTISNPSFSITNSGTVATTTIYTVTTSAAGCSSTDAVTVTVNPMPTTTASTTGSLTCSTTTVALNSTLAGMSYTWAAPSGGSVGSANTQSTTASGAAGVYTLTIKNAGGCTYTTTTSVTQNTTVPTTTASTTGTLTCSSTTVALNSTLAGMNYTWTAPAGGSVGSANTQSTTASGAAGTYSLLVVNPSTGCTFATTTSVTQNTTAPLVSASNTTTLTCTTTTAALTGGPASGVTYQWSGAGFSGSTTGQNAIATAAGTYTLLVTSTANSCTAAATTAVTQNTAAPTGVSAGTSQTLTCASASVTLTGSVATPTNPSINWTGANVCGTATTAITAACGAGVYTLTATNPANGCFATSTVQVFPSAGAPTVTNNPVTNTITCTNTLVTVSITTTATPVSYTWTGTGIVGAANTSSITVSQGGTFQYTVTNTSNGCSTSNNQVVVQNTTVPTTTASTSGTLTCATSTVALNSTLAGMNYTWTAPAGGVVGSASTQSTSASGVSGTYSLTVVNPANGCSYSTTTSVTQNTTVPTTTASTTGTLTCSTLTVALNSTLAGMTYTWTAPAGGSVGSANTQSTTASGAAGTYTVKVVNTVNGCSYTTTTSVTQNTIVPTTTASTTGTLTCTTSTVALTSTLAGMNYTWTAPAGGSVGSANTQSTTASGAPGTYSLLVVNPSTGCTFATTTSVTQSIVTPTTTASTTGTLTCASSTVALNSTLAGMNYTWTAPAGGSVGSANTQSTTAAGAAGTYSLLVVNPSTGCTFATTTSVTQNTAVPTTTASTTGTLTCSAATVGLNSTLAGMNYTWTAPSGGTVGSANTQSTTASGIAGTYSLMVVNPANGCSFLTTTSVSQNTAVPTTTASTTGTLTCTTLSVSLNSTLAGMNYTWTAPAGGSVAGANAQSTSASGAAGIYSLTVVNATNGCSFSTTTSVSQNTIVPTGVSAGSDQTLGCGSGTMVTLTGSVATPTNATASWAGPSVSGSTTSFVTSANGAGIYTLTAMDPANGCNSTSTVQVMPNAGAPAVTVNPVTNSITCTNTMVTVSISTTVSPVSYAWSGTGILSGNGTATITVDQGGTFNYTLTNTTNSCTASGNTVVIQNTTVPTTTASTTGTLTCANLTVDLNSTLTGVNYTWTAPAGGSVGSANTQSTTASGTAGSYSLTVIDPSNGCTYTTTTAVSENTTAPATTASAAGVLTCTTFTVDLNSTLAGMNYTWTAPAGGSVSTNSTQATIASGTPGDYTLTVIDPSNGCTFTTSATVTENTVAPTGVSAGTNQTLTCSSSSVTLTGSVATPTNVMVDWGTGVCGTQTTIVTEACAAGVYTLTAIDPANGCIATSTVEVFPNAGAPTATISSAALTIDCVNSSQSVTVTSTPSTDVIYNWSNTPASASVDSSMATFNNAGTYICTVTNTLSGCSTPVQVVVTTNTAVPTTTASATGMLTCVTFTVDLNSTLPGMNYTWTAPAGGSVSTNSTQATVASGAPGDYTLTVIDPSNGCTYSTTATVTQNTVAPTGVSAGSNQTLTCGASSSVTLTGSVTSPTNAVLDWGTGVCGTQTTAVTQACAAGVYTLTATDPSNGCIATSTVEVFPNAGAPTVTISSTALTIDCNNATQSVTVTSTPATDVLYHWNNTPASASVDSSMATFNNAGTYICTVTNTISGCSTPVQVVVTTNTTVPAITITGTQTLTCATPSVSISVTTTPASGLSYSWSGTLISGQGTDTVVVNQPDTYTVTITNAANGCTNTASSQVLSDTNVPVATISATSSNSIITCQSPSVTLSASVTPSGTYSYTWSPSGGNNASATVNSPNVYSVVVLNQASGCVTSAQYTVTGNTTVPTAAVNDATISCGSTSTPIGGSITTATNASYSWSTSGTGTILGGSTSTPTVNAAGAYVVTVTNNDNGCTNTATVNVSQTSVTAAFTANPMSGTAPLDVNFNNQSSGATSYTWDFGDIASLSNTSGATNPAHTYNTIGTYTVTLTASNGSCSSTATVSIEVLENSSIIVPNVFTPNGDGKNDLFKITSTGLEELNCDIFNRWGLKLYTIKTVNDSWDGGAAPDGTYFFILTAKGYDGKEFKQEGFINLFR